MTALTSTATTIGTMFQLDCKLGLEQIFLGDEADEWRQPGHGQAGQHRRHRRHRQEARQPADACAGSTSPVAWMAVPAQKNSAAL